MTANVASTQPATARTDTPTAAQHPKHRDAAGQAADGRTRPMTAEELFALPESDVQYELVRGQLREVPMAGWQHGSVEATSLEY